MATAYHNLSDYDFNSVPSAENMKFGIVVSEWNYNITGALLKGAVDTLKKHGAKDENIMIKTVPGSFELTFGANQIIEYILAGIDLIDVALQDISVHRIVSRLAQENAEFRISHALDGLPKGAAAYPAVPRADYFIAQAGFVNAALFGDCPLHIFISSSSLGSSNS